MRALLRGALLRGVVLRGVVLRGVVSLREVLRGVVLRSVLLRGVVLRGVLLRSVLLRSVLGCAVISVPSPTAPVAAQTRETDAIDAVEDQLRSMGADPLCERAARTAGTCELMHQSGARTWPFRIVLSAERRTVVLALYRIARIDAASKRALRHLAELNWELLETRLQWNPNSGEVRLVAVLPLPHGLERAPTREAFQHTLGVWIRLLFSQAPALSDQLSRSPTAAVE